MGDSINPFAVLGVDEAATPEEVRAAYRARAKQLHPDLSGGDGADRDAAEAAMAELTFARSLLTDEATRVQYRRTQQHRRQAAAERGEALPRQPSRARDHDGPGPPPTESPVTREGSRSYREAARTEFAADTRTTGTPWVAAPSRGRRRGWRR